jgi:hypothetical protein
LPLPIKPNSDEGKKTMLTYLKITPNAWRIHQRKNGGHSIQKIELTNNAILAFIK